MQGIKKRYDGHVWTKTITTTITNDMGLSFQFSSCVGHLRCENKECADLTCEHRIFKMNETEFDGCTLQAFVVARVLPKIRLWFARCVRNLPLVLPLVELRSIMSRASVTTPVFASTLEPMSIMLKLATIQIRWSKLVASSKIRSRRLHRPQWKMFYIFFPSEIKFLLTPFCYRSFIIDMSTSPRLRRKKYGTIGLSCLILPSILKLLPMLSLRMLPGGALLGKLVNMVR